MLSKLKDILAAGSSCGLSFLNRAVLGDSQPFGIEEALDIGRIVVRYLCGDNLARSVGRLQLCGQGPSSADKADPGVCNPELGTIK